MLMIDRLRSEAQDQSSTEQMNDQKSLDGVWTVTYLDRSSGIHVAIKRSKGSPDRAGILVLRPLGPLRVSSQ